MKLKRQRKRAAPDQPTENFRAVRGPHKDHATHNYTGRPALTKAQRAEQKRRRRQQHGPTPDFTPTDHMSHEERNRLRGEVIRAARGRCQCCGRRCYLTLDHIVPRSLGGGNHRANLQALCEPCNQAKGLLIWAAANGDRPLFL